MAPPTATGSPLLKQPRGIFLFSSPRTASNLLARLLSKQDRYAQSKDYFLRRKFAIVHNVTAHGHDEVPEDLRHRGRIEMHNAFHELQEEVERVEKEGKVPFIKEHVCMAANPSLSYSASYPCEPSFWTPVMLGETEPRPSTNPTVLPDAFLEKWSAVIIIRHPALMLSSYLRALSKVDLERQCATIERFMSVTNHPQRELYDWYAARQTLPKESRPTIVIIDADDVMHNRAVVEKLCESLGMDAKIVQYEWETKTGADLRDLNVNQKIFLGTLNGRSGVLEGKDSRGLDLAAERQKWVAEFGVERADLLASSVENAMSDYEYMWERRLKAG